jgi:aarF domain-containing kinase
MLRSKSTRLTRSLTWTSASLSIVSAASWWHHDDPTYFWRAGYRSSRILAAGALTLWDYSTCQNYDEAHVRGSRRLLGAIMAAGGIYVKLGQHIAALEHLVPTAYVTTLSVLQDKARPSSLIKIEDMVLDETGSSFSDLFQQIDPVPLGGIAKPTHFHASSKERRLFPITIRCCF